MITSFLKEGGGRIPEVKESDKPRGTENKVTSYEEADRPLFEQKLERSEVIAENREKGDAREQVVREELDEQYPAEEGYTIIPEAYLRNFEGNIVKDSETGQARRIDFVVEKDGKIVESVEVTSQKASKDSQMAKEDRIRTAGGNYIKNPETEELYEMINNVRTVVRRLA